MTAVALGVKEHTYPPNLRRDVDLGGPERLASTAAGRAALALQPTQPNPTYPGTWRSGRGPDLPRNCRAQRRGNRTHRTAAHRRTKWAAGQEVDDRQPIAGGAVRILARTGKPAALYEARPFGAAAWRRTFALGSRRAARHRAQMGCADHGRPAQRDDRLADRTGRQCRPPRLRQVCPGSWGARHGSSRRDGVSTPGRRGRQTDRQSTGRNHRAGDSGTDPQLQEHHGNR